MKSGGDPPAWKTESPRGRLRFYRLSEWNLLPAPLTLAGTAIVPSYCQITG